MDAASKLRRIPDLPEPDADAAAADEFKEQVRSHYDRLAVFRDSWYERNRFYHAYIEGTLRRIVPPGSAVVELGTATGNLLDSLRPARGVGVDLSPAMVEIAQRKYPHLTFMVGDAETLELGQPFEFIVASDLVGELLNITAMLERVHDLSQAETRLLITFHNPALEAVLRVAQRAGMTMPPARQNWIGPRDLETMLDLSDFAIERVHTGLLMPVRVPGLAQVANRYLSQVPGIRYLNVVNTIVARPVRPRPKIFPLTCTVVIPCRNEVGNIEAAIRRTPMMGAHTELIFVDGASTDGTRARIEELRRRFAGQKDIKLINQVATPVPDGPVADSDAPVAMLKLGKGDAVRKGFEAAAGDVLMILDADLSVPPEDLPRFFNCIANGKAEFVNGSRLVYPMEQRAMKFINYLGNKFFSVLFTWLLGQRVRDTLCGTKALRREAYAGIKAGRAYFGEFDPFGDFDLLFGAAHLGLKIAEVPVRYRRRRAGVSKVRVIRHGTLLLGMSWIAFRKFRLARWVRAWR